MKFKELLKEKFWKAGEWGFGNSYVEVFSPVTKADIKTITSDVDVVRLGVDKKLQMYAWNGMNQIHGDLAKKSKVPFIFGFTYNDRFNELDSDWGADFYQHIAVDKQKKILKNIKKLFPTVKKLRMYSTEKQRETNHEL